MINLFQLSYDDLSIKYLQKIFGDMGGVLTTEVTQGTTGVVSLLPTMFETFNSIVLAVGAMVIVYFTMMGVIKTAHEGEMMGKQWSSLWIPLRMVMGVAALVPTISGYSTIQIIMMWVIVQGIGAADTLWTVVLNQAEMLGSPLAEPAIPSVQANQSIKGLYQGLVCQASYQETLANPTGSSTDGVYYCSGAQSGSSFCQSPPAFDPNDADTSSYSMGPGGVCGKLTYCSEAAVCGDQAGGGDLACRACKAQKAALDEIINGPFGTLAGKMVKTDYSYRNFVANNNPDAGTDFDDQWIYQYCSDNNIPKDKCCVMGTGGCEATKDYFSIYSTLDDNNNASNPSVMTVNDLYWPYSIGPLVEDDNFVQTSINLYLDTLSESVRQYITQERNKIAETSQSPFYEYARGTGWIMAGALFYVIGQENNGNLNAANPDITFNVSEQMKKAGAPPDEGEVVYRNNYNAAKALIESMEQSAAGNVSESAAGRANTKANSAMEGSAAEFFKPITDAINSVVESFMSALSGSGKTNPLIGMQQTGYTMLFVVGITYLVLLLVIGIVGALVGITPMVLGTGTATNPLYTALSFLWTLILPVILGVLGTLLVIGATLGVYVPLIPYIIFTMGAIGWFLSTIEAMVAGPLVALGILSPGGQSEILGKAEPALMLLFNIFLRPALMIFGLVASLLLASVVVDLINTGFLMVITSITNTGFAGGAQVGSAGFNISNGKPAMQGGTGMLAANPVLFIIVLVVYSTFIVSAMNKCFSAIHIIPEKVTRWIGSQGEQYGEGEAVREAKGASESGAKQVEGGAQSGKGALDTHGGRGQGRMRMKKEQDDSKKDNDASLSDGDGS